MQLAILYLEMVNVQTYIMSQPQKFAPVQSISQSHIVPFKNDIVSFHPRCPKKSHDGRIGSDIYFYSYSLFVFPPENGSISIRMFTHLFGKAQENAVNLVDIFSFHTDSFN